MATPPHSNSSSGCFAAILRRMLCRDGLPTHPSDDISELKPSDYDLHHKERTSTTTPGVVARLMGLESLPDTTLNRLPNRPGSVPRSRSVNFMDCMLKLDLADQPPQQFHRRVQSSVSFRQVPNEVFVLFMDNVGEKKKVGSNTKQKKPEVGSKNPKQEQSRRVRAKAVVKKEKVSKLKDEPRRVRCSKCNGGNDLNMKQTYRKQAKAPKKLVSRKESPKKTEHDQCSSVDSSPVSVLGTQFQEEVNPDGKMSYHETEYLMEVRSMLCRLAEEDIQESNWSSKDDIGDMCVELGGQILNQLLQQVVDEIVSLTF